MNIQKAKHLYLELEKKKPSIKSSAIFEKHDGWFGYLDFPSCIIHSRKLREIPSCKDLSDLIRNNRPAVKGRLIFEIMIDGYEIDRFHELNGILNRKHEQVEGVYLRVHDFIPDWQPTKMKFNQRYAYATEIVSRINLPQVKMSAILGVSGNPEVWQSTAKALWSQGKEGIILKEVDAPYEPGSRVSSLMKIKEECTIEMLVMGVREGSGEHTGMLGSVECKDELGVLHEVGCGTLKHKEREEYFETPSKIIGCVVEVKAMKKLKDGAYREPRVKAIRHDKEIHELG